MRVGVKGADRSLQRATKPLPLELFRDGLSDECASLALANKVVNGMDQLLGKYNMGSDLLACHDGLVRISWAPMGYFTLEGDMQISSKITARSGAAVAPRGVYSIAA
jgi:hypothetical protein